MPSTQKNHETINCCKNFNSFISGHTMYVEANNRQISLPNIVPPQNTCCSTWSAEQCTRDVRVTANFTITCAVTSGTPTELKWSVWNNTLEQWEKVRS